jgi:DNA-binding MarR family transcriptional regulator
MPKPLSDKQLIADYKRGDLLREIAERYDYEPESINNRLVDLRKRRKIGRRKKRAPAHKHASSIRAAERRAMVKTLRLEGQTNEDIADALDMSVPGVALIVKSLVAAGEIEPRKNRFE